MSYSPKRAFTFIELLVVVSVCVLLLCLALPALAKAKTRSPSIGCLSNLRQLQAGCGMYSEEYNGSLMPNAPAGSGVGWCVGTENWTTSNYNTNRVLLLSSLMGPYVASNVTVFRCPGDLVPSANGQRLRSYSMNGQMGSTLGSIYNSGWRTYLNEADLVCPAPKDAFVFCDEHPGTLYDGYLQGNLTLPEYPDLPASYLEGGCGFSFADGHGEIHKWKSQYIMVPVTYGVSFTPPWGSSGVDMDWLWLRAHSACK